MPEQRGYLLNATGDELSQDMTCPFTIEPWKLDNDAEEFFYDELNTLPIGQRVERIKGVIERNRQLVGAIIVENNELGRALLEKLPDEKFVASTKRPGTKMHLHYTHVDRMKAPSDEWLKLAAGVNGSADRDFTNLWTQENNPNANAEFRHHFGGPESDLSGAVSVNVGPIPTDADIAGLDSLVEAAKGGILDLNNRVPMDPMDALREEAVTAKVSRAIALTKQEMESVVKEREKLIARLRCARGNLAADLFEFIKHGDEKHQDWLKSNLENYFNGLPAMSEEQHSKWFDALKQAEALEEKNDAEQKSD